MGDTNPNVSIRIKKPIQTRISFSKAAFDEGFLMSLQE